MYLAATFIFLFGLALGSFLNVVIFRYNTGRGLGGRSRCFTCGKKLFWYELIPVVSFIALQAKCRGCGSKISWQYPAVELTTGLLFLATFLKEYPNIFGTVVMLIAWCLLMVILVYDLKHKIIPDGLVYSFAGLSLIKVLTTNGLQLTNLLAGPILFLPFFFLWFVSRGRWIGLGDGKLALGIGWMLGLSYGISALFLAFWIGAVTSIAVMVIARLKLGHWRLTMKSEIPFAPYLILGMAIAYFGALDVLSLQVLGL